MHPRHHLQCALVLSLVYDRVFADYTVTPRWGQAVALINDVLFVHGGRTDQYNEYSYTSAPPTNDLLFLSLSSSFDPSSPPWQYVGGSSNSSLPQGPSVAWHTLSAYDTNDLLVFGGVPGPNSPTVQVNLADSAYLLDVYNRLAPSWTSESRSWANEPVRRMYLSASSTGGKVYIIGGEKADGSGTAFSDHYVFDPSVPSFTQLPTSNSPPDLYGHASVVLSNGSLLVVGGYSPSKSSLISFSQIWALDTTQSNLAWSSFSVSNSNLPNPRRGFAAVKLDGDRVLIHGGGDATLQTTYSDGWILDTGQNPATWSSLSQLSQLGARKDHFAVALGSEVVFGFGYGSSGPASAALEIFDISSSAWQPSYTPIPTYTATTLPPATQIGTKSGSGTSAGGSGSTYPIGGASGSSTRSGYPGYPGQPTSGSSGGDGSGSDGGHDSRSTVLPIALGTLFGALGLFAGGAVIAFYVRRHRQRAGDAFHLLGGGGDDDESAHLEGAGRVMSARMADASSEGWLAYVTRLGRSTGLVTARGVQERRDMLADEDTQDFGIVSLHAWGRHASESTASTKTGQYGYERPKLGSLVSGSWASLRTLGGTMLGASGTRKTTSRDASGSSRATAWYEKDELLFEPFSDTSLMRVDDAVLTRPKPRRQSSTSSVWSYTDPFEDPEIDVLHDAGHDHDEKEAEEEMGLLAKPPHPGLRTAVPKKYMTGTPLSPVTEVTSRTSVSNNSQSSHEQEGVPSPYDTLQRSSLSSQEYSRSPPPRPTSIIDANPRPTEPLRRSDSWWSKFAKTSWLDRRPSDPSRSSRAPLDFRDPQPPPRLVTIEESPLSASKSPESPDSSKNRRGQNLTYSSHHARSMSSLQTAKTADSEALERIAATVDVVQRMGSHVTSPSTTSTEHTNASPVMETTRSTPPVSTGISSDDRAWRESGAWSSPGRSLSARAVMSHNAGTPSDISSPPLSRSAMATPGHESDAMTSPPLSSSARATLSHATDSDYAGSSSRKSSSAAAIAGHTPARSPESEPLPPPSRPLSTRIHSGPTVLSPEEMTREEIEGFIRKSPSSPESSGSTAQSSGRRLSSGNVANRVQAYERRLSQDIESSLSPPPRNTRQREERTRGRPITINYGLVQRPSLFVANPDDRHSSQGSSDS